MRRFIAFAIVLLCSVGMAAQPCADEASWSGFVNCKVKERIDKRIHGDAPRVARDITVKDASKEEKQPSSASNATSLVDQTSAPDVFGLALNLAKLNTKAAGQNTDAFTFATSAYALYAFANKRDPLDPDFYRRGSDWRRFSFSLGRETPDDSDSKNQPPATLFSSKFLIINHRDLATPSNIQKVNQTLDTSSKAATATLNIADDIQAVLGLSDDSINKTGGAFTTDLQHALHTREAAVDTLVDSKLGPLIAEQQELENVYNEIKGGMQWSINFQSKNRSKNGDNEYRLESAVDLGVQPRVLLTIDAGFHYLDRKLIGRDQRGGRLAEQFAFRLTEDPADSKPIVIQIASEQRWETKQSPTYQFQARSSIPLIDGIEIPISITWANRTELIKEDHVRARFGFSFDLSRLATRFK